MTLDQRIVQVKMAYLIGSIPACDTPYLLDRVELLQDHLRDNSSEDDQQWRDAMYAVVALLDEELDKRED